MGHARISGRRSMVAVIAVMWGATLAGTNGVASPAYAAPRNDAIANARVIASIPSRIVQNTQTATSSADDGECVGGNSVWYRDRPVVTDTLRADTWGSDFDTVLAVFRGSRTNRQLVACNDDALGLTSVAQAQFVAGATYWIAVSTCCGADVTTGGRSVLSLYRPRAARVTVTLGAVETGVVSGRLYASGTIRCNTRSTGSVSLMASQRVGTAVARGSNAASIEVCRSAPRDWRMVIDSETGWAFERGTATTALRANAFDGVDAVSAEQVTNVRVGSNPNRSTK